MDNVQPALTTDPLSGLEPSMLEYCAQPMVGAATSSCIEPEPLVPKSIVRPIKTGAAQLEVALVGDSHLEPESSAPGFDTQPISARL